MINGFSAFLIGLYLFSVTLNGNADNFITLIKGDKGFIKWVFILYILYTFKKNLGEIGYNLFYITIAAMVLGIESKDQGISKALGEIDNLINEG